jgi:hypothetical protein
MVEKWLSNLKERAEQKGLLVIETTTNAIDFENSIEVESTEENISKFLEIASMNKLPIFIYKDHFSEEEIELAKISMDDVEDDYDYKRINIPEFRRSVKNRVIQHNKKLSEIPIGETVSVIAYIILGSSPVYIFQDHERYEEWVDLKRETLEDIIEEEKENVDPEEIEKEIEKREQLRNEIRQKWIDYLMNNEDFKLCTNQKLRRSFMYAHIYEFENTLSPEEKAISIRGTMWDDTELAWKKIKEKRS